MSGRTRTAAVAAKTPQVAQNAQPAAIPIDSKVLDPNQYRTRNFGIAQVIPAGTYTWEASIFKGYQDRPTLGVIILAATGARWYVALSQLMRMRIELRGADRIPTPTDPTTLSNNGRVAELNALLQGVSTMGDAYDTVAAYVTEHPTVTVDHYTGTFLTKKGDAYAGDILLLD